MPASVAWKRYGTGNGAATYNEFVSRLNGLIKHRAFVNQPSKDPVIGCIILEDCIFLPNADQRSTEDFGLDFPRQVVKYKTFSNRPLQLERPSPTSIRKDVLANLQILADKVDKTGVFLPNDIIDARERVKASIVRRQGQPAFRRKLLAAYDGKCAATGCDALEVLEAAHIIPYKGSQTNSVENGLLLRADIHTLFDLGLIVIDTKSHQILLHPGLRVSSYAHLHNSKLTLPREKSCWPNTEALEKHRKGSGF